MKYADTNKKEDYMSLRHSLNNTRRCGFSSILFFIRSSILIPGSAVSAGGRTASPLVPGPCA